MPWPMRLGPPPRMMIFSRRAGPRLAIGGVGLAGFGQLQAPLVRRIHVGRRRGELGRAGVDALEHGRDAERTRASRTSASEMPASLASRASEKPIAFSARSCSGRLRQTVRLHARLLVDDLLDAGEEPRVDLAGGVDLLDVEAEAQWPARPSEAGQAWASTPRRGSRSCRRRLRDLRAPRRRGR